MKKDSAIYQYEKYKKQTNNKMKNKKSSYIGSAIGFIGLLLITLILLFSSCSGTSHLTLEQEQKLNKIDYQLSKLWDTYQYESDSLILEYDNIINKPKNERF